MDRSHKLRLAAAALEELEQAEKWEAGIRPDRLGVHVSFDCGCGVTGYKQIAREFSVLVEMENRTFIAAAVERLRQKARDACAAAGVPFDAGDAAAEAA